MNETGLVAFLALLTGTGVGSTNDRGIWIGDGTEAMLVVRRGDAVLGRTIAHVNFSTGSGGSDGRRRALNDFGQLTYSASFTEAGGNGIFLFTPDLRWRREVSGDWDDADNWTLTLPPAHVHSVSVNPDVDLVVAGPSSDRVVKSLSVGGGLGAARVELAAGVEFAVLEELRVKGNGVVVSPGVLDVGSVAVESGGRVEVGGEVLVRDQGIDAVAGLIGSGLVAAEEGRALGYGPVAEGVLVKQTWGGDANLDGSVTIADLSVVAGNWQGVGKHWYEGDFTGDGVVNVADLSILAGNWQKGVAGSGPTGCGVGDVAFGEALGLFDAFDGVVVPEPGAIGLLGMVGLMALRRRGRQRGVGFAV